jgi:hypothetical protein
VATSAPGDGLALRAAVVFRNRIRVSVRLSRARTLCFRTTVNAAVSGTVGDLHNGVRAIGQRSSTINATYWLRFLFA